MKRWICCGKKLNAALLAFALCLTTTTAYGDAQPVDLTDAVLTEQAEGMDEFPPGTVFYEGGSLQEALFYSPIIVNDTVRVYSLKRDGETYLSDHFQVKEFASHDGADTIYIDEKLIDVLQNIRNHFGAPVTVTSGYRTEKHNAAVGGVVNSYHTKGMAADIKVKGHTPLEVAQYAQRIGIRGIGCYSTWVHVDTRVTPAYYWDGDSNPVESFLTGETGDGQNGVTGDVDGNGVVQPNDALLALKQVISLQELTQQQFLRADADKDGKVTSYDALLILKWVVGIF